jgi:hypothetical protein
MLPKIIILIIVIGVTWALIYIKPNAKRILPRTILGNAYLDVELKYPASDGICGHHLAPAIEVEMSIL